MGWLRFPPPLDFRSRAQGMHEVLAPFVALSDPELPTADIALCYGAFIKRFLPYAFNKDEEFLSLQVP